MLMELGFGAGVQTFDMVELIEEIDCTYAKNVSSYQKELKEMTWLDRLWYCGSSLTDAQLVELQEALPNCEMSLGRHDESTGGTWREHENYYEMRDFFGMYYMKGGTNGVDENGNQKY